MPKIRKPKKYHPQFGVFFVKTIIFIAILGFSIWLAQSSHPQAFLDKILPFKLLAAFIAGMMYSSLLTSPLSIAALFLLGLNWDPITVAVIGGLGAMTADFLIVKVLRNIFRQFSFAIHLPFFSALKAFFKAIHFNFLAILMGLLIVASPLPDELGLVLLGASKLSYFKLLVLTFVLNTFGLLVILSPLYLIK